MTPTLQEVVRGTVMKCLSEGGLFEEIHRGNLGRLGCLPLMELKISV